MINLFTETTTLQRFFLKEIDKLSLAVNKTFRMNYNKTATRVMSVGLAVSQNARDQRASALRAIGLDHRDACRR